MNIRDMVKVQKKNQLFRNCALVLRYVPRELLFSYKNENTKELTLGLEKQLIHEKDWKDDTDDEKKNLELIQACIDIATVSELHEDSNSEDDKQTRCGKLLTHLIYDSNTIKTNTRRGAGNYILINNAFKNELDKLDAFSTPFFNISSDNVEYLVNGCIKMSTATFNEDIPMALIGYNGASKYDGGIVLAEDDENKKYAIADRFLDSDKYYRLIKLV